MNIKVITTAEELKSIGHEWNRVVKNSYRDVVPLTHEWISAWWNNFGEPNKMHVVVLYDDNGEISGIAPLMKVCCKYRGFNIKKISLMANGHTPSSDFIINKKGGAEAVKNILAYLECLPNLNIIELTKLDSNSYTHSIILDHIKTNNKKFGLKNNTESPFITINSDWDTFFKNRSQKFRKAMRNKINRAEKSGDLSVEKIQILDGNNEAIREMFKISGNSWKKNIGTDIMSNPRSKSFYSEICDRLGPHGVITLWFLKKGNQPIAFEFHLTYNNVVYPIRADYDESFSNLSPGSVLEYNIIKSLFNGNNIKEYNTCGHTYNYLMNWTDNTRKNVNIEIFNENFKSYGLYILEYKLIPFLRKLKLNKLKQAVMS